MNIETTCNDFEVPIVLDLNKVFNTEIISNNGKTQQVTKINGAEIKNNESQDRINDSIYNRTFKPYKRNVLINNQQNNDTPLECFNTVLNKWPRNSKTQFNENFNFKERNNNNFWGDNMINRNELDKSGQEDINYSSGNCPESNIHLTNNGINPPTEYLKNIDIDSRFKNIDYKSTGCGNKNFKNNSILSSNCDNLFKNDHDQMNENRYNRTYQPLEPSKFDTSFTEWNKQMKSENINQDLRFYVSMAKDKPELLFNNNTHVDLCPWPPSQNENIGLYRKDLESESALMTEQVNRRKSYLDNTKQKILNNIANLNMTDEEKAEYCKTYCYDECGPESLPTDPSSTGPAGTKMVSKQRTIIDLDGEIKPAMETDLCNLCPAQPSLDCDGSITTMSSLEKVEKALENQRKISNNIDVTLSSEDCKQARPDPTGPAIWGPRYQEISSGVLRDMWNPSHGPCRNVATEENINVENDVYVRPEYSNWETATLAAGQLYDTGSNKLSEWAPEM